MPLPTRIVALTLGVGFATLSWIAVAPAQQRTLELMPFMGAYVPAFPLRNPVGGCYVVVIPDTETFSRAGPPTRSAKVARPIAAARALPCDFRERSAFLIGGHVTGWVNNRMALEVSALRDENDPERRHVVAGSLRILFSPSGHPPDRSAYLIAGGSFVHHAFSGDDPGQTDWGGVAGVGLRIRFDPGFSFRAEIEDYLYLFPELTGPGITSSEFQSDLVFSLGVALAPLH